MPIFYQQNINEKTKLAIWKITETPDFFNSGVTLNRLIAHPHKRLQHLAGRYLLPYLFSDFPNSEIEIADTRKPYLPNEQYHFSISHCDTYAAAIVSSDHRVGVDVELITPRLHKIKSKFLHPEELRSVNNLLPSIQLKMLSVLWSAKEAMYKWYGLGEVDFSEMLRIFPFLLADAGEIDAVFLKSPLQQQMKLHYQLLQDLTLVWVVTEK